LRKTKALVGWNNEDLSKGGIGFKKKKAHERYAKKDGEKTQTKDSALELD